MRTPSTASTVARNTLFGIGAQLILKVANFVFGVLIVRNFGDATFGQYSIVLAWASLFSVLGNMGISEYLTREIARDHNKAVSWFWDMVVLRLLLAVVAATLTVSTAIIHGYNAEIVVGIGLFTATYFIQAFLQPLLSVLQGNERVDITSVLNVISQIMFIFVGSIFLYAHLSFVWLIAASTINLPVLAVLSLWAIRKHNLTPPTFSIAPSLWKTLLRAGFPFALTQLSLSFAFDSDTVILSLQHSNQIVGWYAAAYKLMLTFLIFSAPFNQAVFPSLSRQYVQKPQVASQWYFRTVKIQFFFTLPLAVGGMILADKAMPLLYGDLFLPSALAFAILVWYLPFHFYTAFAGNLANTMQREAISARVYGFEGILNIALNFILIPPFGLVGACLATVLTMMAGSGLFYFVFRQLFGPGLQLRRLLRIGAASAFMGLVVWQLHELNIIFVVLLGIAVYFFISLVLGVFTHDEIRSAMGYIARRLKHKPAVSIQ